MSSQEYTALSDLFARLAETDRQERRWLNEEIAELRTVLAAVLLHRGGKAEFSVRTISALQHYHKNWNLKFSQLGMMHTVEFIVKGADDAIVRTADGPGDMVPADWWWRW